MEAIFQDLKGVESVTSGFSGGTVDHPTYKQVCSGTTGHAEVIHVVFDPREICVDELLEIFWNVHDPTTLNRQGNDVGTHYRSAVFYHTTEQKEIAEKYKQQLDATGVFKNPIVTEITPFTGFFPAEDYHTNYFNLHGEEPYCNFVVRPKVEKFRKAFAHKLKS